MNSKLNVVFHHIRKQVEDCTSPYDLCEDQMHTVLSRLCDMLNEQGRSLGVFFDDGYLEHYASAIALQEMYGINVVLGVPTESVGEDGYMTWDHIKKLASTGHTIASHGVSHAALGRYENDVVLPTPADGLYRNTSKGKGMVLSAAEVAYQVVESHRVMITSGVRVDAFIYPYGIFNKEIRDVVVGSHLYTRGYTCEMAVESEGCDRFTLPRVVIDRSLQLDQWIMQLADLTTKIDEHGRATR